MHAQSANKIYNNCNNKNNGSNDNVVLFARTTNEAAKTNIITSKMQRT